MSGASTPRIRAARPLPGRLRLEAVPWVLAARGLLWLRPFGDARRTLASLSARWPYRGSCVGVRPLTVGRAVRAAAQVVPHATCLPQALAAEILLHRAGRPARLHLAGSLKGKSGFYAHAWVESGGQVVVGGGPGSHAVLGVLEGMGPMQAARAGTEDAGARHGDVPVAPAE